MKIYEAFLFFVTLLLVLQAIFYNNWNEFYELSVSLTKALNEISLEIFLVLTTASSAAFYQWRFRKNDENNKKVKEATRYNEAVVYLKSLIEDIRNNYAENVLPQYIKEKQELEDKKKFEKEVYKKSLTAVPELGKAESSHFLEKIPNLGKYYQLIAAFYYVQAQIVNFNIVTTERTLSIKEQRQQSFTKVPVGLIQDYAKENLQKTTLLLGYSDGILEALTFISQELEEISKEIRGSIKKISPNIKVLSLVAESENQKELRENLKHMVETETPFKGRVRYLEEH